MVTEKPRAIILAGLKSVKYNKQTANCWTLCETLQLGLFGRTLPTSTPASVESRRARAELLQTHPERDRWVEAIHPTDGALVLMSRNHRDDIHCGVFLDEDGGRVWHSDKPHGVVADTVVELTAARGWRLSYLVPR